MPEQLNETVFDRLEFLEESAAANPAGPWKVKAIGITLDEVNGNRRLYPLAVAQTAVDDANRRLQEGENIDGKIEHLDFPDLTGTAFNWLNLGIENKKIILEGYLLGTDAGRNLRAMHKGKMKIRLSQRARGDTVNAGGYRKVTAFKIFDYDATGNPSDGQAGVTILESTQDGGSNMSELAQQISEFIDAQAGTYARFDESTRARLARAVKKQKPGSFDEAKQLLEAQAGDYDTLLETAKLKRDSTVQRLEAENAELQAGQNQREVEVYLAEAVKEAKYPKHLEEAYLAAVQAGKPETVERAKELLEEQRAIFDPLAANSTLQAKGFGRVNVLGPVIEKETGFPEFAKVAYALGQKLEESNQGQLWDVRKPQTQGQRLAARVLALYDQRFGNQLLEEARLFEAETTSDLAIPFSMVRAVVAEAYPALAAAQVFDFQTATKDPEKIGYEVFTGETGYSGSVTDEDFNSGAFSTIDGISCFLQIKRAPIYNRK